MKKQHFNVSFLSGAENTPIVLSGAKQSSTSGKNTASLAIDGSYSTRSQTICQYNESIWFQVDFPTVLCVGEVRLLQIAAADRAYLVWRMEDTRVTVLNSGTRQESLCNTLKVKDDQRDYVLQCGSEVCGDGLKLWVEHPKPGYDYQGCLHVGEIEVCPGRCPEGTVGSAGN